MQDIVVPHGATSEPVALAWLLQVRDDVVPIPGTKRRAYLKENVRAADLILTDIDVQRLNEVGSGFALACSTGATLNFSFYGLLFVLSLSTPRGALHDALGTGLLLAPMMLSLVVVNGLAGRLERRLGRSGWV